MYTSVNGAAVPDLTEFINNVLLKSAALRRVVALARVGALSTELGHV